MLAGGKSTLSAGLWIYGGEIELQRHVLWICELVTRNSSYVMTFDSSLSLCYAIMLLPCPGMLYVGCVFRIKVDYILLHYVCALWLFVRRAKKQC